MAQDNLQSNLPLSEAALFILLSLAPGPKHGYAILKDVQHLSEGRVVFGTGTLYGALKRFLVQNWIERASESAPDETGHPRKAYALTRLGRRILEAEITRLRALVKAARLRVTEG